MRASPRCLMDRELEQAAREFDRALIEFGLALRRRFMSAERDNPVTVTSLTTRALQQLKHAVESGASEVSLVSVLP